MKKQNLIATLAVVLATTGLSHASLTGLDSSPLGDRSSPSVEFATWDIFATTVISNLAAQTGDLNFAVSQSVNQPPPYGPQPGNDLFYTSSKASNWTLSGTASIDINTVVLQVKISTPASGTVGGFFTATLNDGTVLSATPVTTALSGGDNAVKWTWSNLDIDSGETFSLNFSNPAGFYHVTVDSFSVDVAPVPEPSTYGLAAALLLAVVIWRRRSGLKAAA